MFKVNLRVVEEFSSRDCLEPLFDGIHGEYYVGDGESGEIVDISYTFPKSKSAITLSKTKEYLENLRKIGFDFVVDSDKVIWNPERLGKRCANVIFINCLRFLNEREKVVEDFNSLLRLPGDLHPFNRLLLALFKSNPTGERDFWPWEEAIVSLLNEKTIKGIFTSNDGGSAYLGNHAYTSPVHLLKEAFEKAFSSMKSLSDITTAYNNLVNLSKKS